MSRVNLLLLMALVASCLYLVHLAYESRRLFTEVDRARAELRRLDHDHERLLTERQSAAAPARVDALARTRLGMRVASPSVTQFVNVPDTAPTAPGDTR
jgi:cell division protein FtsL